MGVPLRLRPCVAGDRVGAPLPRVFFLLSFVRLAACLSWAPQARANCEEVLAGKSFWIRLLDPVGSYSSKPGSTVRAVLIQSPGANSMPVFRAAVEVDGEVVSVRRVGLGSKNDTGGGELILDRIVSAAGSVLPI